MSYVSALDLVVTNNNYPAIAKATFEIDEHPWAVVQGQNGSGKTTLLKAISGLIIPYKGSIEVTYDGLTYCESNDLKRHVSYIGHQCNFMRHNRVKEHLELCAKLDNSRCGISAEYTMSVSEALDRFSLKDRSNVNVDHLSAGQQRRLTLASACVQGCELLCVDEPHSSLDSISCDMIDEILVEQYQKGRSLIIASHHSERFITMMTHKIGLDHGVVKESINLCL